MSVGVTLLTALVEKVAAVLDDSYDAEIVEMHHRNKADAPSGTAKSLGEAVAKGRQVALNEKGCFCRNGLVGARKKGEIGFATLRGGDVVGEHTVVPDNVTIGKNSIVSGVLTKKDFGGGVLESGKTLIKAGDEL